MISHLGRVNHVCATHYKRLHGTRMQKFHSKKQIDTTRYSLIIKIESQKKLNDFYFVSKIPLTVLSCQYPTLSQIGACKGTWTTQISFLTFLL